MSTFAQLNLNQNIFKAITACGYTKPTDIQSRSIPEILQGRDIVASAQTGTGKTAAFVLPALHRLSEQKSTKKTSILILTPTRELASQITKAAGMYGKFLSFRIVNLVGGMPYHHQIRDLARGADIIVATPGRLMDHMQAKRVDLSQVKTLVLDEADRMLDMGFIEDVEYIAKLTPSDRQTLLFSATVDKRITTIVRHLLKNPVRIDLSNEKIAAPQIKQELYKASSNNHKTRMLKHFLSDENIYKAIIFSGTKINADRLADELRDDGFSAAALHGDLRQNVRNRTIEQLRNGKIQYLVATDVAARGIDISDITHVFNFDMPKFCEDYVHRIGRTGRAGKTGVAISFVMPTDVKHVQRIEKYIGQRLKINQNPELPAESAAQKHEGAHTEILSLRQDRHEQKSFKQSRKPEFRSKRFSDESQSAREGYNHRTQQNPRKSSDNFRSKRSIEEGSPFSRDGHRGKKSFADKRQSPRAGFRGDDGFRSDTKKEGRRSDEGFRGYAKKEGRKSDEGFRGYAKKEGRKSDEGFRGYAKKEGRKSDDGFRDYAKKEGRKSTDGYRGNAKNDERKSADGYRGTAKKEGRKSADGYRGTRSEKSFDRPFKKRATFKNDSRKKSA